jgi:ribosome biogenesis ATPase
MLRPGRLDKALYVDLPNTDERLDILKTLTKKTPLAVDVNLKVISADLRCEGMSGADLASIVREAAVTAIRGAFYSGNRPPTQVQVCMSDFMTAFTKVSSSVSQKDRKRYELLKVKFGSAAHPQQG